jgi:MYXO-CTERM domain-containing protein
MTRRILLCASLLFLVISPASATIAFLIDGDTLKDSTGGALGQSSLFMLVSSTTNGTFEAITEGSFTAVGSLLNADDRILFRGDLLGSPNVNGVLQVGTGALTLNTGLLTNWTVGDPLALLWFPTLTAGSNTIPAGTKYGLYTNASAVDGSDPWITPADGATDHNLIFYTKDGSELSPGAGATNLAAAGNASLTVDAVPEPSRSMLGLIGFGMLALRRRRR